MAQPYEFNAKDTITHMHLPWAHVYHSWWSAYITLSSPLLDRFVALMALSNRCAPADHQSRTHCVII